MFVALGGCNPTRRRSDEQSEKPVFPTKCPGDPSGRQASAPVTVFLAFRAIPRRFRRFCVSFRSHFASWRAAIFANSARETSRAAAMAEDAITDEVCDLNPFKGIRIRANDPRARKKPRLIRVFTFEEMHRFAKSAGRYEAMVRVFTDCGLRAGGGAAASPRRLRRRNASGPPYRQQGPNPRRHQDRPRPTGRRPRRPGAGDHRLDARSPDPAQRRRLRVAVHHPERPPLARADLLPRPLEACPRKPPALISAPTSAAIAMCRICGPQGSMTRI